MRTRGREVNAAVRSAVELHRLRGMSWISTLLIGGNRLTSLRSYARPVPLGAEKRWGSGIDRTRSRSRFQPLNER